MSIAVEGQLRIPVITWLAARDMSPVFEVYLSGLCDIVGVEFLKLHRVAPQIKKVVAVELKMDDVGDVLRQATSNRYHVPLSYAAMPKARVDRMRTETLRQFERVGVGLIAVGAIAQVVIEAAECVVEGDNEFMKKHLAQKLWRRRDEWKSRLVRPVYR